MPSEFHNREPPPPPSEFLFFFWKYIFHLATALWTNEHEFMPPQGCHLAVPGDKLYSSATRKNYRQWPGCANSFLSLNVAIKINTTYGNFTPLCFLVLFWHLQSKIAQIQTAKTFRRANTVKSSSIFLRCVPFICHVVCTKSVLNLYASCSVHECLKIWQASWKWGPSASFLLFIRREWQLAGGKIHFRFYSCDKKLIKVHAHILLFTVYCYKLWAWINMCSWSIDAVSSASVVVRSWFVYKLHKSTTIAFSRNSLYTFYSWNTTCEIPPCLWISNPKYSPLPSEFHNRELPLPFGNPKSRPSVWNRPFAVGIICGAVQSPGFLGQLFDNLQRAALLMSLVQYDKVLAKFGQQLLVMVNYAHGVNQSQTGNILNA